MQVVRVRLRMTSHLTVCFLLDWISTSKWTNRIFTVRDICRWTSYEAYVSNRIKYRLYYKHEYLLLKHVQRKSLLKLNECCHLNYVVLWLFNVKLHLYQWQKEIFKTRCSSLFYSYEPVDFLNVNDNNLWSLSTLVVEDKQYYLAAG
jgi:hypothetical protein